MTREYIRLNVDVHSGESTLQALQRAFPSKKYHLLYDVTDDVVTSRTLYGGTSHAVKLSIKQISVKGADAYREYYRLKSHSCGHTPKYQPRKLPNSTVKEWRIICSCGIQTDWAGTFHAAHEKWIRGMVFEVSPVGASPAFNRMISDKPFE